MYFYYLFCLWLIGTIFPLKNWKDEWKFFNKAVLIHKYCAEHVKILNTLISFSQKKALLLFKTEIFTSDIFRDFVHFEVIHILEVLERKKACQWPLMFSFLNATILHSKEIKMEWTIEFYKIEKQNLENIVNSYLQCIFSENYCEGNILKL